MYRAHIIRMQEDKVLADSKEAAAKGLPPERQVAHAERQAGTMPRKDGVSSTSMSATLYPDWVLSRAGKRMSPDMPQPYQTPREDAGGCLTLEEELDASNLHPAVRHSQSGHAAQDVTYHGPGKCTPEPRPRISCYARHPSRTGPR